MRELYRLPLQFLTMRDPRGSSEVEKPPHFCLVISGRDGLCLTGWGPSSAERGSQNPAPVVRLVRADFISSVPCLPHCLLRNVRLCLGSGSLELVEVPRLW